MTINLPKAAAIVLAAALCACTRPPEIKRGQFPLPKDVEISASHPIRLIGLSVSNPQADAGRRQPEWVEGKLDFKDWP